MPKTVALLAAAVVVAACAAELGRTAPAAPASCGKLLPPSWGSYLGAFPDFNPRTEYTEDDVRGSRIAAFERLAGHRLSWVYFSQTGTAASGSPASAC